MIVNPMLLCDFYKLSHKDQYPKGTTKVYSTWTPRMSRIPNINKVVAFGFQAFVKEYLVDYFNENFFKARKRRVVEEYTKMVKNTLGIEHPDTSHIEALWDLGYLPIEIRAVKEGARVPIRCPMLTIENTHPDFFWLTNYLETLMSACLWMPCTSATIANQYRTMLDYWAVKTSDSIDFVKFQGHDFSMRGMAAVEAAMSSGAGHLLSFMGTDTIPAISYLEEYYNADVMWELVGTSIPASEHSVMCCNGMNEAATFRRFLTELYPKGMVSIVSDTWNFWYVLNWVVRDLKKVIMSREGKCVIRPDSGDPVKIVCGDPKADNELERKGAIEILWEIFGGTVNSKGYKELDPHIGCIYGDAITLDRCGQICELLAAKGFASTNMVFGIRSYTYQYNTRDTFGFAIKSTYAEIDGKEVPIFKDPITDTAAFKKSQKGMVRVLDDYKGGLIYQDEISPAFREMHKDIDHLVPIFKDGKILREQSLADIRALLAMGREVWLDGK